jgi:hypothetical protein
MCGVKDRNGSSHYLREIQELIAGSNFFLSFFLNKEQKFIFSVLEAGKGKIKMPTGSIV